MYDSASWALAEVYAQLQRDAGFTMSLDAPFTIEGEGPDPLLVLHDPDDREAVREWWAEVFQPEPALCAV